MRLVTFTLIAAAAAATTTACGDNRNGTTLTDAAPGSDAPPDTATAVIVAGDFNPGDPGVLSVVDTTTLKIQTNQAPAGAVDSDPVLRKFGDELFVVNRSDNNVTILKASDLSLVEQIGTGANSNPQDVAIMGDKLYVPVYGGTGIVILTRGSTTITPIALDMDDQVDHKPDCASIFRVDDSLYVSCQNLDANHAPRTAGKIYVVGTDGTVQPSKTITLTHGNPLSLIEQVPAGGPNAGDLVVSTVGDFAPANGCVEQFTPGATPHYVGCLTPNTDLGGFANRIDFATLDSGDTLMWLAVAEDFPHAALRGFDLMTKELWSDPLSPSTESIIDVAACPDGSMVLSDGTTGAVGVRVYYSATEQTTSVLSTGVAQASAHGIACF